MSRVPPMLSQVLSADHPHVETFVLYSATEGVPEIPEARHQQTGDYIFLYVGIPAATLMRLSVRCAKPHIVTACENIHGIVNGLSTAFPSKRSKPVSHTSALGIRW